MTLREKIALFPHSPGVYRYYDAAGNVIYIGKAKDLHKRTAQYFVSPERLSAKTRILVSQIADAQFSVVDSESDALLLENNLIKQCKPKYNILLKDAKTYPWICVTGETFPRVLLVRRLQKTGGNRFFGPYSNGKHARALMDFLEDTYPLRTCKLKLDATPGAKRPLRPCLKHDLKRCSAPCTGNISHEDYMRHVEEIVRILSGETKAVIQSYRQRLGEAVERLEFEAAEALKLRLESLESHYAKSIISSAADTDADVFSLLFEGTEAYGNFLRIRGGTIIQSFNLALRCRIEEARETVLSTFMGEIAERFGELSKEIVVPFAPDVELPGKTFKLPQRGEKLALLELSAKNAREFQLNQQLQQKHTDPARYHGQVLEELRGALGMQALPCHMECFDNSNIQGTHPVASCVVFRDAQPSKGEYRHFKIKTVVGANDYASMQEVVFRRYARMLEERPDDLPQLIVIDGGKGQLDFAWKALTSLGLDKGQVTVIGLAKRLEEVLRVGDPYPLFLDRNSSALKTLQQIRDEAHRFGITFHRKLRSKGALQGRLREIRGVGEKTEQRLLLHFGSVAQVAKASREALSALVGESLSRNIHEALHRELQDPGGEGKEPQDTTKSILNSFQDKPKQPA